MKPRFKTVIFDADSTLSAMEGIDWLAQQRGPQLGADVAHLTIRAMSGELPIDAVYAMRLDAIKPTRDDISHLSEQYIARIESGATELITQLMAAGVRVIVVSGGLRQALLPMVRQLGIPDTDLHAVDIEFDTNGVYEKLGALKTLTRQTGKPELIAQLALERPIAMIGDGATDSAAAPVVDEFIAYTGVVRRPAVVAAAHAEAANYAQLETLLFDP